MMQLPQHLHAGGHLLRVLCIRIPSALIILVYGGVEENCSAGALFASQRDELADKVHAMLFG